MIDLLHQTCRKLLEDSTVNVVIGYGQSSPDGPVHPVFITRPGDVDKLVWNDRCFANLAVYLTRKEIKAPDEFQNWMAKAYEWFKLYGAWVGLAAAVIVVAIIAGVLLSRHAETSKVETSAALDRALAPIAAKLATRLDPP